jgi:GT2 family glycosyltransferase
MDLSVIIVNWNTRDLLRNCLNSVYRIAPDLTFEVIVVDNASRDGSVEMIREEFPDVSVMVNMENSGFGAANNQALAVMKGRYALLLNTDAILTEKSAPELFHFMENHPDAAMACGQLLNEDGSKQNSIANFPTLLTLLANVSLLEYLFPRHFPSKRYEHREPVRVDSGVGACLIIRKKAMDVVGMFDERYFFFFEETDWAYRMHKAGWKVYHVPAALVYHLQGQSIGGNIRSRIEFYRSRYQFFRKWKGRLYNVAIRWVLFLRLAVNWLLTSLGNIVTLFAMRELRAKWAVYSKLLLWHFRGCP